MTKTTFAITFLAITLLMTAATFQSALAVELVTNGSFEDPDIAPGTFVFFPVSIPGIWLKTSGLNIEIQDNVAGAPGAGNGVQFVELDSDTNSGMKQTLTTVIGENYVLTFDYSPRPGILPDSNGIEVFWDGGSLGVITADGTITGGMTDWNTHQFFVSPTGVSTDLEFVAVGISDRLGGYIDVVSVDRVPNEVACSEEDEICKSVFIDEEVSDGVIEVGELIVYKFHIDAMNTSSETWVYVEVKDRFGGDLAVGDQSIDLTEVKHDQPDEMMLDNLDCELTQKGKTQKEFLDCIVDDQETEDDIVPQGDEDFSPGETASVWLTVETDYNFGQSKKEQRNEGSGTSEYTSCGVHSINSGASIHYFFESDVLKLDPQWASTDPISVDVFDKADLSEDCDGDEVSDADEIASGCMDPFDRDTDNDGLDDGVEDANKNGVVDGGETDPCNPDSDGDGFGDGTEVSNGTSSPILYDPCAAAVNDTCLDVDGTATGNNGVGVNPLFFEQVTGGAVLTAFGAGPPGLLVVNDSPNNGVPGVWDPSPFDDDIWFDFDPAHCPAPGFPSGFWNPNVDCLILDADTTLIPFVTAATCDLSAATSATVPGNSCGPFAGPGSIVFLDGVSEGLNVWAGFYDDGEDIIIDGNGDGIFN